jgi:hypothetical protein
MKFDPCDHKIRQLVIKAGKLRRKERGLPEEKNITLLYNETAPLLGIEALNLQSKEISKLPGPHELINHDTGKFIIPRKDCLKCGGKGTVVLMVLCRTCTDAENGLFKTMWKCEVCGEKERSKKFFIQWLKDLKVEIKTGMKIDLGIKTATDGGDK